MTQYIQKNIFAPLPPENFEFIIAALGQQVALFHEKSMQKDGIGKRFMRCCFPIFYLVVVGIVFQVVFFQRGGVILVAIRRGGEALYKVIEGQTNENYGIINFCGVAADGAYDFIAY